MVIEHNSRAVGETEVDFISTGAEFGSTWNINK